MRARLLSWPTEREQSLYWNQATTTGSRLSRSTFLPAAGSHSSLTLMAAATTWWLVST